MAASAGACKRLAVQGVEGARVTFRREMRTDTSSKGGGASVGRVADKPTKLVANQHDVGKKPRALRSKAVNTLYCYRLLRQRRLANRGKERHAVQCVA